MTKTNIKAVIFDCFGVLTGDKWKEFVASLSDDQRVLARDLMKALDKGMITQNEFVDQVASISGRQGIKISDIINSDMHKNDLVMDYIRQIKPRYKLAVLSNVSTNWIRESFLSSDEIELFDKYILSYDVQLVKPDPEIYREAARRLGVELEQCLFIDDSPGYTQAAERLGMSVINYQNFRQFKLEADRLLGV